MPPEISPSPDTTGDPAHCSEDTILCAPPTHIGHNTRKLQQFSKTDTIALIGGLLEVSCDKHEPPEFLSSGNTRAVFGWPDDDTMAAKVSLQPEMTTRLHPWEQERRSEFQEKLRLYFPKEWILPEYNHKLLLGQQDGKTWALLADFQRRLGTVYPDHARAPSWCYRCPERGGGTGEVLHPNSLTVHTISPPMLCILREAFLGERERYLRVTQLLLQKPNGTPFQEEEFLHMQESVHLDDLFARMDVDALLRDKVTDFIDACTVFSMETDEMLDGMGRGNILFREDQAWDPLLVDVLTPGPPRTLKLARSILQHYGTIALKDDPDRCRRLRKPLVILAHAISYVRALNASRRKLGLNPADDIALLSNESIEYLPQVYDDMRAAFGRQHTPVECA